MIPPATPEDKLQPQRQQETTESLTKALRAETRADPLSQPHAEQRGRQRQRRQQQRICAPASGAERPAAIARVDRVNDNPRARTSSSRRKPSALQRHRRNNKYPGRPGDHSGQSAHQRRQALFHACRNLHRRTTECVSGISYQHGAQRCADHRGLRWMSSDDPASVPIIIPVIINQRRRAICASAGPAAARDWSTAGSTSKAAAAGGGISRPSRPIATVGSPIPVTL